VTQLLHTVRADDFERKLLAALVGQSLLEVTADAWACAIVCSQSSLLFTPREVATPDPTHPHGDVDRLAVSLVESPRARLRDVVLRDGGVVLGISVLTTELAFSPPMPAPEVEIKGVTIPAGVEYSGVFSKPGRASDSDPAAGRVVVDVGVELATSAGRSVVLYTNAVGHFALVAVDNAPAADWWPDAFDREVLAAVPTGTA